MPGLSRWQFMGPDLSSRPEDGMDPRSRSLASNRDPYYSNPNYTQNEDGTTMRPMQSGLQVPQTSAPETHKGTLEDARRQGTQNQPTNLLELLRRLGIL